MRARSTRPGRCPEEASTATTVISSSAKISLMSPDKRRPGPTSTKVRTPSSNMALTHCTKSTGEVICLASTFRAAAEVLGYLVPVVFAYTGTALLASSTPSRAFANGAVASATNPL